MKKDMLQENRRALLTEEDYEAMSSWGDQEVAFIKSDKISDNEVWKIYTADGTQLAIADSRDFAFILARQNDLDPKSVH